MSAQQVRYPISPYTNVAWLDQDNAQAACPNCNYQGPVKQVLEVDYRAPREQLFYHLQLCPTCSVLFSDTPPTYDYDDKELIEIGWPGYYAQMGVGPWEIASALHRVRKPAGAQALEIGGAYGFGLDYCLHARQWRGIGYDPSPLAGVGAEALGLNVVQGLFDETHLADGPWDIVIATELIEHIETPQAFLHLMRRAVAENGVLVLTTPAAEAISPSLSPLELDSLIVPNRHVMLHSAKSLTKALNMAGFTSVRAHLKGTALIVYASASPLQLDENQDEAWRLYRHYMQQRAATSSIGSDLHFCFAGRAMFDAVNDADFAAADLLWDSLNAGSHARFGYYLNNLTALPVKTAPCNLLTLGEQMPHGLGMILFARAMRLLAAGETRAIVRPILVLADESIEALQNVLKAQNVGQDTLSASIQTALKLEVLLCDAEAGSADVVPALLALNNPLAGWRGFVALVNAGTYDSAIALQAGLSAEAMPLLPASLQQDIKITAAALFCGQVNTQNYEAAWSLLKLVEPLLQGVDLPERATTHNVLFAAGLLFLQDETFWPRSVASFARLRQDLTNQPIQNEMPPLFWPSLRGEILALNKLERQTEAQDLLKTCLSAYPSAPDDLLVQ